MGAGWVVGEPSGEHLVLVAGGNWDIANIQVLDEALKEFSPQGVDRMTLDLRQVENFDTAGAWLAYRVVKTFRAAGCDADYYGLGEGIQDMLEHVASNDNPNNLVVSQTNPIIEFLERVGRKADETGRESVQLISFLGVIITTVGRVICEPSRFRFRALISQVEEVGLNALPIVGLISFLIGVVLAYQGATQLQRFGAEIFVVDLIAVSILREIGILLTAIVIAGRSGSAFAAEIGSMTVNEEIDAMRVLGLDPIEVLVLPRVFALMIVLPLLAFFSDMMGLMGGLVMSWGGLDIPPALYFERLKAAVSTGTFLVGIIKAPFFAFLISMVGCLEGLRVQRSAESVGYHTTRSVVTAIFLVIIFDALFSIFFASIGI